MSDWLRWVRSSGIIIIQVIIIENESTIVSSGIRQK